MKKKKLYILLFVLFLLYNFGIANQFNLLKLEGSPTEYIKCGNMSFPAPVALVGRVIMSLLQIVVPLILIVLGSMDMLKATTANKDSDIAKYRNKFFTRVGAGLVIFFILTIVKILVGFTSDKSSDFITCLNCLTNDKTACGEIVDDPYVPDAPDKPDDGDKFDPDEGFIQPPLKKPEK